MNLVLHQLTYELRIFSRNRELAVFIFIFPLLLYALLAALYSGDIDGVPAADIRLAGLFGYAAANTAFAGLTIILVSRREAGVLKRIRSTPLPAATYLGGFLLTVLVVFAVQSVALLALARLALRREHAGEPARLRGAIVLGCLCFAGMGVGAASLIRSADGVSAVVNVIVLPMAFLSGVLRPVGDLPGALQAIADVLPLTYFLDIVEGIYLEGESLFADPAALAVVLAWGAAGLAVALRWFRWMPRREQR